MELKCKCDQCAQPIEFPAELVGQAVACPHCKFDTVLTGPAQTAKPIQPAKPAKAAKEFFIEDRLENIGDTLFVCGIIGAVLGVIAAAFSILGGEVIQGGMFAASALALYVQVVIIRILFYAISKHLRLQVLIATNTANK